MARLKAGKPGKFPSTFPPKPATVASRNGVQSSKVHIKKNASRVTVSLMAAIPRKKKNLRFCHSPTSLFIFELVTVIHIVSAKTNINEKTSDPSSLHFSESLLNTSTLLMHADASPKRSIFISPSVSTRLAVERNALRRGLARKRLPHR